jgi:hypothetical protein
MPVINARDPSGIGKRKELCRRSFRTCDRLGAAIPLPKRVSPPGTEVGLPGLTKLLISRENELGLRGSPRGGPSEGRAGNQRDQCESSDKCLHHISPCLGTNREDQRLVLCIPQGDRLSATVGRAISSDLVDEPTIEALIHWFAQLVGGSAMPWEVTVARRPLGWKFSANAAHSIDCAL